MSGGDIVDPPIDEGNNVEPPIDEDNNNIKPPTDEDNNNIKPPTDEGNNTPGFLDISFIDKEIIGKADSLRSYFGSVATRLESRHTNQVNQEASNTQTVNIIESADVAKEMMEKIKNQSLLDASAFLFSENMDNYRGHILQLLR